MSRKNHSANQFMPHRCFAAHSALSKALANLSSARSPMSLTMHLRCSAIFGTTGRVHYSSDSLCNLESSRQARTKFKQPVIQVLCKMFHKAAPS